MLLLRALNALRSRNTPVSARFHFSFPFEVRGLMMNPGIPDEIQMEEVPEIEASGLPAPPQLDVETIELTEHLALVPALANIARYQIARTLRNLKPHLHAHRSFGQRSQEGFEQPLQAIPSLIARVIRLNASNLEPRREGAIDLHGHVVQQIADAKLLAQRGRAHRLFIPFGRQRHA